MHWNNWGFSLECKVKGTFENQSKSFTILRCLQKENNKEYPQKQNKDMTKILGQIISKILGIQNLETFEPDCDSREHNTNDKLCGKGRDIFPFISETKQSYLLLSNTSLQGLANANNDKQH